MRMGQNFQRRLKATPVLKTSFGGMSDSELAEAIAIFRRKLESGQITVRHTPIPTEYTKRKIYTETTTKK